MKSYNILKLKTLSLENRIKKNPPNFDYNLDYFYYLISEIIIKSTYRLEQNEEEEVWIPLCSQIMNNHPYKYRNHIRYLCENFSGDGNVLHRQNYSEGQCFSYKISPAYYLDTVEIYEIKDKKLLRYINKNKEHISTNNKFKKRFSFLIKFFTSGKLKINLSEAMKENDIIYNNSIDDVKKKILKQRLSAAQIIEIENQEFRITYRYKTDGRLHTELTRINKKLRKFIKYNNETLGEVDISSAVPTFLYYLLKELISTKELNEDLKTIFFQNNIQYPFLMLSSNINSNISYINNEPTSNKLLYHYMLEKASICLVEKEIDSFGHKLQNGSFYESFESEIHTIHLFSKANIISDFDSLNYPTRPLEKDQYLLENVREICGREFDGDCKDIRKVLKKRLLSMMFAKPSQYVNEKAMFNMYYPSILKWINEFKKKNHELLSYLMFQTESYFMINIVARKFNNKFKGKKPLFTLHDCLITTKSNLDNLHQFMSETLSEHLGFKPVLTKEVWE